MASDNNKVEFVSNAYFMIPVPHVTTKPLKPPKGRVWKLGEAEASSGSHGFHHLRGDG